MAERISRRGRESPRESTADISFKVNLRSWAENYEFSDSPDDAEVRLIQYTLDPPTRSLSQHRFDILLWTEPAPARIILQNCQNARRLSRGIKANGPCTGYTGQYIRFCYDQGHTFPSGVCCDATVLSRLL